MKTLLFQKDEWAVLLSFAGAMEFCGIDLPTALSQKELQACVYRLSRSGMLTADSEGRLSVSEALCDIVRICAEPEQVFRIETDSKPVCGVYIKEGGCVLVEGMRIPSPKLTVTACSAQELLDLLILNQYLPEEPLIPLPREALYATGEQTAGVRIERVAPPSGTPLVIQLIQCGLGWALTGENETEAYSKQAIEHRMLAG